MTLSGFRLQCSCGEILLETPEKEVPMYPAVDNAVAAHLLPQMEGMLRTVIRDMNITPRDIIRAIWKLGRKS